jgi:hypothetical protein
MPKWFYTGKVYRISEFGILDMDMCTDYRHTVPSRAHIGEDGPWIDVTPHPDNDTGELWAEVQQKGPSDAEA